jgi:hypothetical protein
MVSGLRETLATLLLADALPPEANSNWFQAAAGAAMPPMLASAARPSRIRRRIFLFLNKHIIAILLTKKNLRSVRSPRGARLLAFFFLSLNVANGPHFTGQHMMRSFPSALT